MPPISTLATNEKLALMGGPPCVPADDPNLFAWPIVTTEDETAVLDVLRQGKLFGIDVTKQFEQEWSAYQGVKYSIGHCNGTSALLGAMFGVGLGRGDELIVPSLTYWASGLQTYVLGATPVFADIDPVTLCIDPKDIARRITPRTKAIMVVHYCGHPCDMDPILAIARQHKLKVIEDVSHAHGGLYKGKMVGSIGDVGAMSMMGLKSFAIGEAGMLCTNDRTIYERAIAFGHYERMADTLTLPDLKCNIGYYNRAIETQPIAFPMCGLKFRMNQTCAAMGRVQLKYYDQRIKTIQDAMNRFWDLLEGVPGLRPHRTQRNTNSTMGGWYNPLGHYHPKELGGLPVKKFIEAVNAEGGRTGRSCNFPLHLHPVLNQTDAFHDGKPTRIAFADRDVRQGPGSLPVSEALVERCFGIPWFKHDCPEQIAAYARAYKKVALHAKELL